MSPAPDVTITRTETPPPRSSDTDTGKLFLVGQFDRGPVNVATECLSKAQVEAVYGVRQSTNTTMDEVELFFGEGGARLIVGRAVGSTAANASRNLSDGSTTALVVTAKSPGTWGNGLTVEVTHPTGSTFNVIVREGSTIVYQSGEVATTADAVTDTADSDYVDITQGASTTDPAVLAASALSGGVDGTPTDTERQTALNLFGEDYGPGQVKVAGATAAATHAIVQAHCETYGRNPINDGPDTATVATITGIAATDRAATGARNAELLVPWVTIPALATGGPVRTIPPGAGHAGIMARNDGAGITPNQAAAGDLGQFQYATGLSQVAWSKADRDTLADAGVTVIREIGDQLQVFDALTLADPDEDPNWIYMPNARFFSKIRAEAREILRGFMFRQIDGQKHLFGEVKGDLTGLLLPYWSAGSLYGDSPAEAFSIDVETDNTPESIAAGELHATLALRMSPPARTIELAIVKVAVDSTLA